ncbi:MAG: NAD(P)H-hydrate dehydratase [Campylobacterales bacterium]
MKPLFKNVYNLDRKCYSQYRLTEEILMEHAAYEIGLEIKNRFRKGSKIGIFAGPGNNGADGITLGRILEGDYEIFLYTPLGVKSEIGKLQLERYREVGGRVYQWRKGEQLPDFDVVVDALFGSGLKRDLPKEIGCLVKSLNYLPAFKIACDIPTGIDVNGNLRPIGFRADLTVTMGAEKLALYSDFAKEYVGEIKVADLGVSFQKYREKTFYYRLECSDLQLPIRTKQNSHKRTYGHLGVVIGEKPGAGIIAAETAFNFGTGLVTGINLAGVQLPYEIIEGRGLDGFTALAVGMGLGNKGRQIGRELVRLAVEEEMPVVIDADLFYEPVIKELLNGKKVVLTPHPKEFAGMIETIWGEKLTPKEVQLRRFELVERFGEEYPDVVLLLKGANRLITYKRQLYIDPLGDVALAKGGSGDVLSGLIGGLLAQGYHPLKGAISGSLALSLAGRYTPNYGLTPKKLIKRLDELVERVSTDCN